MISFEMSFPTDSFHTEDGFDTAAECGESDKDHIIHLRNHYSLMRELPSENL